MARTIDTGNALGAKVLWSDAYQDGNFSGRTDEKGGQAETSVGSAVITGTSPGPGLGALDGTAQGVTSSLASALSYPFTLAAFWQETSNNGTDNTIVSYVLDDSNYFGLIVANGSGFDIRAYARAGGSAAQGSGGAMGAFNTWYASAAIFESTTKRRVWHNGSMGSDDTTSMAPTGSGKVVGVGDMARASPSQFLKGWVKYVVIFNGALTGAELASWAANPEQIYTTPGTTISATVGNAVAAGTTASVTNAGAQSINATVGNAVAAGATATVTNTVTGTITLSPLVNFSDTPLASETGITAVVLNAVSGAVIATKTNLTTDASGQLSTIADAAIAAGTAYRVVLILSGNRSNVEASTAA